MKAMDFSKEIRASRKKNALTQTELSKRSGVMQCTISRYERGIQDITADTLIRLAKALNDGQLLITILHKLTN